MTLALLVPRDYRHLPVLVRFTGEFVGGHAAVYEAGQKTPEIVAALRSFGDEGGEILRLHRDDQTPRLGASR